MHSDTEYRPIESPFHTFAEFRRIVNRVLMWQSTDMLVANAQVLAVFQSCQNNGVQCVPPTLQSRTPFNSLDPVLELTPTNICCHSIVV